MKKKLIKLIWSNQEILKAQVVEMGEGGANYVLDRAKKEPYPTFIKLSDAKKYDIDLEEKDENKDENEHGGSNGIAILEISVDEVKTKSGKEILDLFKDKETLMEWTKKAGIDQELDGRLGSRKYADSIAQYFSSKKNPAANLLSKEDIENKPE